MALSCSIRGSVSVGELWWVDSEGVGVDEHLSCVGSWRLPTSPTGASDVSG